MRKLLVFTLLISLFCLSDYAYSNPPTIETHWSHRQVAHLAVNPDIPEGSIFLTFSSDQTIFPISPPDGLISLSPTSWQINRPWDDLEPLTLTFRNSANETTQITAVYSPQMPFSPLIHDIPVVQIITDPENLWHPETGIQVFGSNQNCLQHGTDWERPAIFQFYNTPESPLFTENAGLRIHGGWSRNLSQKGQRLYFDDYANNNSIDFIFFNNGPTSFQRLVLKSGYSPSRCINSAFAESIFLEKGHLCSRSLGTVLYLNNEYWGFVTLKERIDDEFIEHTHSLGSDGFNLIKDGECKEGSAESWWLFLDTIQDNQDYSSHAWFAYVSQNLDLDSYLDWLLINIFGATADNGGPGNLALVQLGDSPWQYIMHDEDDLFSPDNLNSNFFRFFSIETPEEFEQFRPPTLYSGSASERIIWAAPFRGLMQNSEFKIQFKNRFENYMDNEFSEDALQTRLSGITSQQVSEMTRHQDRWGIWDEYYNYVVNATSLWLTQRQPIISLQFDEFLESFRVPVELSDFRFSSDKDNGVEISWRTESEVNCIGFLLLAGDDLENMTIVASYENNNNLIAQGGHWEDAEYEYENENGPIMQYYSLAWVDEDGNSQAFSWVLTTEPAEESPNLIINEFLALNNSNIQDETGAEEDWVEILNTGSETINLQGMYLTDNLADSTKWAFPDVEIYPGEYLIIWCDSDPQDGPLHANFKLSASGEVVGLFNTQLNGNQLIDSHVFSTQLADISEGRWPNSAATWANFSTPTPGFPNLHPSTAPGPVLLQPGLGNIFPNPFNPSTTIQFRLQKATAVSINVFDLNGRKVKNLWNETDTAAGDHQITWNGTNNEGMKLPSGVYFVQSQISGQSTIRKLSLIK